MIPPGYESLGGVLARAIAQAAAGKGAERHAIGDLPFDEQSTAMICKMVGPGFALGQAMKKAQEAARLPREKAVHELLGAINYLASAVICLERASTPANDNTEPIRTTTSNTTAKDA